MRRIVVYNLKRNIQEEEPDTFNYQKWCPSIVDLLPPNSGREYIFFWVAHYFRLFRNKSYSSYYIKHGDKVVSSLVCVPPLFIWPFMEKRDIQIKNVFTHPDYRGQGLAFNLIEFVKNDCFIESRTIWYLTHDKNFASLSLCEKAGFKYAGEYKKIRGNIPFIKIGVIFTD